MADIWGVRQWMGVLSVSHIHQFKEVENRRSTHTKRREEHTESVLAQGRSSKPVGGSRRGDARGQSGRERHIVAVGIWFSYVCYLLLLVSMVCCFLSDRFPNEQEAYGFCLNH